MMISAVVKFRISRKNPAFLVMSPYPETPFSQDILVIHCHSPIREPSGVIFNSCLSITTQRKGLQLATERIFCPQNKEPAGICGPSRSLRSGAGWSPLPAAVRGFRIIEVLEKAGQIKEIESAVHPCNTVKRAENAIGTFVFQLFNRRSACPWP